MDLDVFPIPIPAPASLSIPSLSTCLLPSVFPSIRVFSSELALYIRWPKYWSFSFSISPSNEYSGLISFRIEWFDLFTVQVSQESPLAPQLKNINTLALFIVQLSRLYMTAGKIDSFDNTDLGTQVYNFFY